MHGGHHRRVMDKETNWRDTFEVRAGLLGDASAADVVRCRDDLDPREPQRLEAEARKALHGGDRKSLPLSRLPHPISQVGDVVVAVEMIQSRAAHVLAAA